MKSLEKTVKSSLLPNDKARKRKTPNCNFPPDILVFSMLNALKSPNHKKKISLCNRNSRDGSHEKVHGLQTRLNITHKTIPPTKNKQEKHFSSLFALIIKYLCKCAYEVHELGKIHKHILTTHSLSQFNSTSLYSPTTRTLTCGFQMRKSQTEK